MANGLERTFNISHAGALTTTGAGKTMVGAAAGSAGGSLFGLIVFGGFAAVSAIANQIEYMGARGRITDFYREEFAAQHKKSRDRVNDYDLTDAEFGNKNENIAPNDVVHEAVRRERNIRNLGIAASFVASIAVFALMGVVEVHPEFGAILEASAQGAGAMIMPMVEFAAKVGVGLISYLAIKSPLVKFGERVFGLDQETTHERIEQLAKDRADGKAVTREQVVEVFISAHKDLASYVEQNFDRRYEQLPLADKVRVAEEIAKLLPIDKIVHSINLGTTNASELAFTVEGQVSGVLPKSPEQSTAPGLMARFCSHCKSMVHHMGGMFHAEKAHPINAHEQPKKDEKIVGESPIVEFDNPHLEKAPAIGEHQLAEMERRANRIQLAGSPTIQ